MAEHSSSTTHHVLPLTVYFAVFATLMVMTGVTVAVAYIDLGAMNAVAAIVIACFKATIVVLYFMHVKYSTRLIKLTVIAGVYWLIILMGLTMSDYLTRVWGTYGQQISLR